MFYNIKCFIFTNYFVSCTAFAKNQQINPKNSIL